MSSIQRSFATCRIKRPYSLCSLLSFIIFCLGLCSLSPLSAQAADPTLMPGGMAAPIEVPPLITQVTVLTGLALLPYFVMLLTSFVKIVVVLSLLRNALGVQQVPPNQVINGIAIILTFYVMFPTGMAMYHQAKTVFDGEKAPQALFSASSADVIYRAAIQAREPLREFLEVNARKKHAQAFYHLAKKYFPPEARSTLSTTDLMVLIPAFITSQVEDAFQIGVLIYLPFFVIDLVTSNILLAMGMMMLSPMTISLPLKLLLLVMLDGWALLVQGLVTTFKTGG